ncbi:hypothetical protein Cme02nite_32980 [Catellatospora methionotrophica]|uniref:Uncharacterized protein n=1 Tax=Catellatospora methionotrophica TaxID=121620 RepID=A0A8J3PH40_9ACTN|nr:hypothetical protein [Catellatospora methionotrophica]GIG14966.1 hypothetical protein Cme02nite_32980 [Catellatospora methionotrophica]
MRRLLTTAALTVGLVLVAAPAYAFAHNRVTNPWAHTVLDLLTLAVVLSPIVTAFAWGPQRRGQMLALIALVQLPVAIIAFVPIIDPVLHAVLFVAALALTGTSLWLVRRHPAAVPAPAATDGR